LVGMPWMIGTTLPVLHSGQGGIRFAGFKRVATYFKNPRSMWFEKRRKSRTSPRRFRAIP
jgi:hypothetical protein